MLLLSAAFKTESLVNAAMNVMRHAWQVINGRVGQEPETDPALQSVGNVAFHQASPVDRAQWNNNPNTNYQQNGDMYFSGNELPQYARPFGPTIRRKSEVGREREPYPWQNSKLGLEEHRIGMNAGLQNAWNDTYGVNSDLAIGPSGNETGTSRNVNRSAGIPNGIDCQPVGMQGTSRMVMGEHKWMNRGPLKKRLLRQPDRSGYNGHQHGGIRFDRIEPGKSIVKPQRPVLKINVWGRDGRMFNSDNMYNGVTGPFSHPVPQSETSARGDKDTNDLCNSKTNYSSLLASTPFLRDAAHSISKSVVNHPGVVYTPGLPVNQHQRMGNSVEKALPKQSLHKRKEKRTEIKAGALQRKKTSAKGVKRSGPKQRGRPRKNPRLLPAGCPPSVAPRSVAEKLRVAKVAATLKVIDPYFAQRRGSHMANAMPIKPLYMTVPEEHALVLESDVDEYPSFAKVSANIIKRRVSPGTCKPPQFNRIVGVLGRRILSNTGVEYLVEWDYTLLSNGHKMTWENEQRVRAHAMGFLEHYLRKMDSDRRALNLEA